MANDKKEKKENKHFFKDFKTELKKVTWPTGKQLINNTVAVITIVFITAAIVFVLDLGFEMLNKYGINKLKSAVNNNKETTVVDGNNGTDATSAPTDNSANNDAKDETTDGQDNTEVTPSPEAEQ